VVDVGASHLEGGADHGHHGGLAVAAEGVLEDARELGVAVGDVLAAAGVGERGDDVAEGAQALVDLLGLLEALARRAREAHALGACEVDEVELSDLEALLDVGLERLERVLAVGAALDELVELLHGHLVAALVQVGRLALRGKGGGEGRGEGARQSEWGACGEEGKLAPSVFFPLIWSAHLLGDDDEDGVGARRELVHLGGPRRAHGASALHEAVDLRGGAHDPL
jgi:hypothetical protein